MKENIREMAIIVLEEDNEVMSSALEDEDFDKENKKLNRLLIKDHNKILDKLRSNKKLSKKDMRLIADANEIYLNDTINITEFHKEAVKLDRWLSREIKK